MPKDYNILGFDLNALKNHMEGQIVGSLLNANPVITEVQKKQLREVLHIFEKHNIGAVEAIELMGEISEVYSE